MIVVCEKCQSRFKLDESRIKASRFKVRCSLCHHVFTATRPAPRDTAPAVMVAKMSQAAPSDATRTTKVIAVSNQKGGVAKTTTCLNLGISLALLQKRVLVVDFDVQANLTILLGYHHKASFYDLLKAPVQESAERFLIETQYAGLWLLPSNKNMVLLNKTYFGAPNYEYILRDQLNQLPHRFDYVLIDTPPSIEFFTLNALTTSDLVIIPTQCDYLSTHGVDQILKLIELVRQKTNPAVSARMLITMYEEHQIATQVIFNKLQGLYQDRLYRTIIPYDERLREAQIMSMPVCHYNRESPSSQQYMALAAEIAETTGRAS
jgi:chromosome partitioning protein